MMKKRVGIILLVGIILVGVLGLSGCNKAETGSKLTTLTWYLPGVDMGNLSLVEEEINKKLNSEYNINLDIVLIDAGNYANKMQIINASKEEYDLCFTSNWMNDFYQGATTGALADITELVPKYAPKLYGLMSSDIWNAIRIDGKLYSVPNWQIQAQGLALSIPQGKLDKVNMSIDELNTFEDVTKYLENLSKVETNTDQFNSDWIQNATYYGIAMLGETSIPGAIYFKGDNATKVINQYETPEFREYVKLMRSWVENGYISGVHETETYNKAAKSGIEREPLRITVYSPKLERILENTGYDWSVRQFSPAVMSTAGIAAAMTGVSATSKYPEVAVRMLEIVNSDKEIFNLICYGVEGKHFEKVDENHIKRLENASYTGVSDFYIGNTALGYLLEGTDDNVNDVTREINDTAILLPTMGFYVDTTNILTEISNCKTVINEQLDVLERGIVPADEGVDKLCADLKKAGADKIVAEYQRQLDEWMAKNK